MGSAGVPVSFWRDEVIQPILDAGTEEAAAEQLAWAAAEPANPAPYYHLAQLYRTQGKREAALGLLLEAVRLDAGFAKAHVALAQMYAVAGDSAAAWRHARASGDEETVALLRRHGVEEPEERDGATAE
jgi:tetratricopeptide (TPR) repeat protein